MGQTFFNEIQGAAVFKHGILRRYLQPWASKVGKYSKDNRVVYLDGYAGPGRYEDGAPGSPALATGTATKLKQLRNFDGICVEADTETARDLEALLHPFQDWQIINDQLENCLPDILRSIDGVPLFAFLDPYGLGIPFQMMVDLLNRAGTGQSRVPTEVLLNFSTTGLRRRAGLAYSTNPAADTFRSNLDAFFGGSWWTDFWEQGRGSDREQEIAIEYVKRLGSAASRGWGWYLTDIPKRWDGPPAYYLIFMTQHHDGLWILNENISIAREHDFQKYCTSNGETIPLDMTESWTEAIKEHLLGKLKEDGKLRINLDVYGKSGTLGYAREKHVRAAVRSLFEDGLCATNPKGRDMKELLIIRN